MEVPEAAIIVLCLLLIFAVLSMTFWEHFEVLFQGIRYVWTVNEYFAILVQEGELTSGEENQLNTDLTELGITVNSLTVIEASEWGDEVELTLETTYTYTTKSLNGTETSHEVNMPFSRKSRANCLVGG